MTLFTDRLENTVSNSTYVVACVSVAAGTFTEPMPENGFGIFAYLAFVAY
jgi:hypothetical protein